MRDKSTFIWLILTQHVCKSNHLLGILVQLNITYVYLCVISDMYLSSSVSKLLHVTFARHICQPNMQNQEPLRIAKHFWLKAESTLSPE